MKAKLTNAILWGITYIMFMVMIISVGSFDSENIILPAVGVVVSLGWLLYFSNNYYVGE